MNNSCRALFFLFVSAATQQACAGSSITVEDAACVQLRKAACLAKPSVCPTTPGFTGFGAVGGGGCFGNAGSFSVAQICEAMSHGDASCVRTIELLNAQDFRAIADEAARQHEKNVQQILELLRAGGFTPLPTAE